MVLGGCDIANLNQLNPQPKLTLIVYSRARIFVKQFFNKKTPVREFSLMVTLRGVEPRLQP